MKPRQYAYLGGAVLAAMVITIGGWHPLANADSTSRPVFAVDGSWPNPLPAPVGTDGVAHSWVQGEVAGNCIDMRDNVYTFNRGWEVGVTVNGVLQGNEFGAINGNDATSGGAIPSPPVVAFDSDGNVVSRVGQPQPDPNRGGLRVCRLHAARRARLLCRLPGLRLGRRKRRRNRSEIQPDGRQRGGRQCDLCDADRHQGNV